MYTSPRELEKLNTNYHNLPHLGPPRAKRGNLGLAPRRPLHSRVSMSLEVTAMIERYLANGDHSGFGRRNPFEKYSAVSDSKIRSGVWAKSHSWRSRLVIIPVARQNRNPNRYYW